MLAGFYFLFQLLKRQSLINSLYTQEEYIIEKALKLRSIPQHDTPVSGTLAQDSSSSGNGVVSDTQVQEQDIVNLGKGVEKLKQQISKKA